MGCGQGFLANYIANWAKEVVGIDISDKSISIAEEGKKELNRENVTYQIGDAERLRFENNSFDIVYSMGVLHHTPNIQKGIDEICRVLKPKGTAIVILYRKYSPKGLIVLLIRKISFLIDKILRKKYFLNSRLRLYYSKKKRRKNHGTALSELFGCPVLKMYSKKEIIKMFYQFKKLRLRCYQPGISRLKDFVPILKYSWINNLLIWIDKTMANRWGFYWVIEGEK